MYSYFAYGLGIHSALPLPEFISKDAPSDVTIRIENFDCRFNEYVPLEAVNKPLYIRINSEAATIYSKGVGVFLVRGGREVVIIPAPDVDDRLIRLYIVGTVMAVLLYQRGLLVLHASVVDVKGGAVAFLGKSGEGKSSTAAAMHTQGYNIIADDVAAINLDIVPATVFPGFPQIKLSSEAAISLGYDIESLLWVHPLKEKGSYRIKQQFSQDPLPLKRIYVLTEDTEFDIEPLRPQEAVIELVRHSRPTTLFHSGGAPHFLQCTNLAKQLTIHRVKRPRSLSLLPDLAKVIEKHVTLDLQQAMV